MATTPQDLTGSSQRRVVLVDFDWEDADLLPQLLRMPGISVRLVAGSSAEDAGVRVAELCGLPRTVELADLTREIFDVALVGERSPRRAHIERLLNALGTPTVAPLDFVRQGARVERRAAPEGVAAEAVERDAPWTLASAGGEAPSVPGGEAPSAPERPAVGPPEDRGAAPGFEDLLGLEKTLAAWSRESQASSAELHEGEGESLQRRCRHGSEDLLLAALIRLAHQLDTPVVVARVEGPQRGRVWGAWPFRTQQRRAILAAAAAEAGSAEIWRRHAEALRETWDRAERGADTEGVERARLTLLPVDAFLHRLEMAVDRNRSDGFRFALHRIRFDGSGAEVEALTRALPEHLRGSDCMCRHGAREILLMCGGPVNAFVHVRRRIVTLWERTWRECGSPTPVPPIADERVEMLEPDDARSLLAAAHGWLAGA